MRVGPPARARGGDREGPDLVRASVARARLLEPLHETAVQITQSALVIGGGVAGMTAALSLAGQGFGVTLVEKDKDLGGNLRELQQEPRRHRLQGVPRRPHEGRDSPTSALRCSRRARSIEAVGLRRQLRVGREDARRAQDRQPRRRHHRDRRERVSKPTEYLYGKDPRVVTQREFEAKLAEGDVRARDSPSS